MKRSTLQVLLVLGLGAGPGYATAAGRLDFSGNATAAVRGGSPDSKGPVPRQEWLRPRGPRVPLFSPP